MTRSSRGPGPAASGKADLRRQRGDLGERAAEKYLRGAGMGIIARGFRFRGGEIDLIARDGDELVFVEVKTRSSDDFGNPVESVTRGKRRKLIQAASFYLQSRGIPQHPCRFDVISIRLLSGGASRLEHLQDAFQSEN
jgi:putative endonuclease